MRWKSCFAVGILFAGLAVDNARAADLPLNQPVPALPSPGLQLYVRGEVGGAWLAQDRGYWIGPGAADPQITESLNSPSSLTGGGAIGLQYWPGIRADVSVDYLGHFDVHGSPIAPGGGVGHSSMDAATTTNLVMGNIFIEPLRLANINTGFIQPFVTVGIGAAFNDFEDWSRTNPAAARPVRTFAGASQTNFAWSVGAGVSIGIDSLIHIPAWLDLTYRYVDAGHISGGSAVLSDPGPSPREPFNFRQSINVATVGLRIPFSP